MTYSSPREALLAQRQVLVDAIDGEVIQHLVEPNPDADVLL